MIKIAVCGCGVVGSGVADVMIEQKDKLSARFGVEVGLGYILDIKDLSGTPYEKYVVRDLDIILQDPEVRIVSITIGGLDLAASYCRRALTAGKHVVTSNKEVVAAVGVELEKLAFEHHVRFLYEASAGGGIPIIRPLNMCLYANDIYEIQGILNGTTNYMLTGMFRDKMSFDAILKDAQQKGFAEANPSADVDGFDAARKIAILSSIAYGAFVDYRDVPCTGIRNVTYADHEMAAKAGYVIKLIAGSRFEDGKVQISVEPKLVPQTNILAAVSSVYNAVLTKGSYTGDSLFYGQGAGKLATASAVVGDIIDILGRPETPVLPRFADKNASVVKEDKGLYRFYVRAAVDFGPKASGEAETILRGIFGSSVRFLGFSDSTSGIISFISDYCTDEQLKNRIGQLKETTGISPEFTMKVLD